MGLELGLPDKQTLPMHTSCDNLFNYICTPPSCTQRVPQGGLQYF